MLLKKSRGKFQVLLASFLFTGALSAQTVSSVRIFTDPSGLEFWVDGQLFTQPVTFLWPQGSKHSITTLAAQNSLQPNTQYALSGATTNLGAVTDITSLAAFTADPAITYVDLSFSISYAVNLVFFTCPPGTTPLTCPSPGTVTINGQPFIQNGQVYVPVGSTATAVATPNAGYVFGGWQPTAGPGGNTSQAFINTWTVNGPITLYPMFKNARPVSVSITTLPAQLQILVDRTPVYAPVTYDWGWNSTHQLGPISPQYDLHGKLWVFDSWSDGGDYSHSYTVAPNTSQPITLTATYVTGTLVTFLTNPPGLSLVVDGRSNYMNYTFAWAPNSVHTVTAPATATDASGNSYNFVSWSNNGPATQQITPSSDPNQNRYTANYQSAGSINIQSTPASGVPVQVDGQACATPCNVARPIGTAVHVVAPATAPDGNGVQLGFLRWSDSAAADRTLTVSAQPQTISAAYKLRYQLMTSSNPPNGVIWDIQPASPDSFYDPQTPVTVAVETKPGFQFLNWGGDASGALQTVAFTMGGPHTVVADLNAVPYITPGGIQNGAGQTPKNLVAPGSAVAIYGVNLASDVNVAGSGKLPSKLLSSSVRVGATPAPLFFVSSGQINVQLPSNVPAGHQTLTVHMDGKPDATAVFDVARNAPGLFASVTDNGSFVVATHQDGSVISVDSPARRGEVVTLYATGLGPYKPAPPDGAPVPAGTKYSAVDPVTVVIGDLQLQPEWAGAAAGRIGVAAVQFNIASTIPHATTAQLRLHVNGVDSNTVLLPVE